MMKALALIEAMSNANGISGFENDAVQTALKFVNDSIDVTVDKMNNCYLVPKEKDEKSPTVLIDGHLDELGLLVQSITDSGLLRVINIGGWDIKNLLSQKMRLVTDDGVVIKGIVASKPVHFLSDSERNKPVAIEDLLVDVGVSSKEEVVGLGIRIGLALVPDVAFEYQQMTQTMIGKAFDNRLGCSLVVETLNECTAKGHRHIIGSLSVQEEVGGRGAEVVGNVVNADLCIVFEGSPADDTFTSRGEAQGAIGKGVQIRIADRTMISHPGLTRLAVRLAKEKGIPYQETVRRGGGTNGATYHIKGKGIPCIVLGVPVRYVHAHYGIAKYHDYEAARELAIAVIEYVKANGLDF
ncbi:MULTISPECIES: M42 family metallopeptidase [unclassified Fusibacter]|uniref:M42 family metallopeptidase n=1 Tax=unclassified Fusibacter TaxID=2624464 RepID=UPI001012887B|nr:MULTISPECIES: M42 family peptidase [unclassified Fusibacter]MCK8059386.1 M42 family peptidase [Fusibacter sp. A2]NPE21150.1 M42 family peptidase [Fusibacter sp. A1]RXV62418.1 M42 family peptidase [Fusibacter sp. A1]